jgi:hypothetical protein
MTTTNPVWYCLPPTASALQRLRHELSPGSDARAGFNYLLILNSACYLEAVMERGLLEIVEALPKASHPTDAAIRSDLKDRIRRPRGFSDYSELFRLCTGVALSDLRHLKECWEGIDALFSLRNLLAHGRAIGTRVVFPLNELDPWESEFEGGYKKVHGYLVKAKVLQSAIDPLSMEWFCLNDVVADHFWNLSFSAVAFIGESLGADTYAAFKSAVYLPQQLLFAQTLAKPADV